VNTLRPLTRRTALGLLLSSAGAGVIAACAPAAPAASTPVSVSGAGTVAATPGARPAAAPKSGGTLRVAISADPASLDGHPFANGRFDTTWLIYDRLAEYDLNLKPQPRLAESWDISTDFKQIKLNLRKGVTFHDGREFTSDDVKYNVLRVRDPKIGAGAFVNQSNWFTSFDTPDKNTIVLKSEQPRPLVFDFSSTTETDPARLQQLYAQVNDLMLDESFGIPLCSRPPTNLARAAGHANNQQFGGRWYRDVWMDA
jgi:peptide/nickel transport system substrate-binding protein